MLLMMILRKVLHEDRVFWKGGSNKAYKLEQQRMANMQQAIDTINSIFDDADRQSLYDEHNQAVYDLNKDKLDEQYADSVRSNRFALARNGLIGGSADIDSNADLQDRYAKGLVQAEALGQNAAAELQASDESAKSNLIGLAESGLDSASAAQQATSSLAANYNKALGQQGAATINDFFNDMSQLYLTNKLGQAVQNNPYAALYRNNDYGATNIRKEYQGS